MKLLSLNAGSSSLKYGVFEVESDASVDRGQIALSDGHCLVNEVRQLVSKYPDVDAIGVRVVHGGEEFTEATVVTESVICRIQALSSLAPLHNPRDLEVIQAAISSNGRARVVAVFDTGFHSTLSPLAASYALPADIIQDLQVRRYGFHGISYRYVASQMAQATGSAKGRMIACHLGSGASVCAIRDGLSVETSMGMTPVEGLIMGTRCGDLDPGALLYILRETGMSIDDADNLINHDSGLLGLSKMSADVRLLEAASEKGDANAEFALEAFAYRVAKYIGAYSVVLNGLDQLVFSGGIGENSAEMRRRVCRRLGLLGISPCLRAVGPGTASQISSDVKPTVWVVKTDEERQIADEAFVALAS